MKSLALIFLKNKDELFLGSGVARPRMPFPLIHLGSYLQHRGVKVYLIDGQVCDAKEELEKIIDKVDIIGLSVMTMQVANSLELTDYIKEKYPSKEIIWGGIHPSLLPEQTLKHKTIDYLCQREGEDCLYELCIGKPLNEIENLIYRDNGKIIINPIREFIDWDKVDKPIWKMLNLENYIKKHNFGPKEGKRSIDIAVGKGCIHNCTYCVNTALGRRWRPLSARNIVDRIKFLKRNYNVQHFTVEDDCFDVDLKRVEDFCNLLIEEKVNITWDTSIRAGKKWTDGRMELLSKSGCMAISIGGESGSNRILRDIYKKGITTDDIIHMAKQCNKYNIIFSASWMCGVPGETEEEVKETIKLIKKVVDICPATIISGPQPYRPYPNTELYYKVIELGYKEPKSLEEWAEKSNEGFLSEDVLPYVSNPKMLKNLEFYCINAFRYPINNLHKILIGLCKLRLKFNFYAFPFEIPITNFYVKKIYSD